jgi:hypothetical protein
MRCGDANGEGAAAARLLPLLLLPLPIAPIPLDEASAVTVVDATADDGDAV